MVRLKRIGTGLVALGLLLTAMPSLAQTQRLLNQCEAASERANSGQQIRFADLGSCNELIEQSDELGLTKLQLSSALINRGILLTEFTEFVRAREDFNSAALQDPQSAYVFLNLGVLDLIEKNYVNAVENFTRASEFELLRASALFNRALANNYQGLVQAAVDDLLMLQQEQPLLYQTWVTEQSVPTLFPLLPLLPYIEPLQSLPVLP